eukprot:gene19324-biopygen11525
MAVGQHHIQFSDELGGDHLSSAENRERVPSNPICAGPGGVPAECGGVRRSAGGVRRSAGGVPAECRRSAGGVGGNGSWAASYPKEFPAGTTLARRKTGYEFPATPFVPGPAECGYAYTATTCPPPPVDSCMASAFFRKAVVIKRRLGGRECAGALAESPKCAQPPSKGGVWNDRAKLKIGRPAFFKAEDFAPRSARCYARDHEKGAGGVPAKCRGMLAECRWSAGGVPRGAGGVLLECRRRAGSTLRHSASTPPNSASTPWLSASTPQNSASTPLALRQHSATPRQHSAPRGAPPALHQHSADPAGTLAAGGALAKCHGVLAERREALCALAFRSGGAGPQCFF